MIGVLRVYREECSIFLDLSRFKEPGVMSAVTKWGLFSRRFQHRGQATLHILFGGGPRRYTDPHRRLALPHCRAAPAGSVGLQPGYRGKRLLWRAETHEHLVDDHVVEDLVSGGFQPRGKAAGVA